MEQSYKEKYEDILARLEKAKNNNAVCDERFCCVINEIIPELAESEDERIRKELIDAVQSLWDNDALPMPLSVKRKDEWLAWLERQGEHANFRNKIQVGDKVTRNENGVLVNLSQLKRMTKPSGKQGEHAIYNVPAREVILAIWDLGNEWKELTNGCISTEYGTQLDYIQKHWCESEYYLREKQGEQKSQRTISAEAKEALFDYENANIKQKDFAPNDEQKPEENKGNLGGISPNWSEEDEVKINRIVACLENLNVADNDILCKDVDWLKSLKDRVQPQPKQEWSKDDEEHIDSLLKRLDALCRNKFERTRFAISEDRDWLKSLRPHNRWKPSELQLGCLSDAIEYYNSSGYPAPKLKELYEQLKKL